MIRRIWQNTVLRWLIVSFLLILSPVYALNIILYMTGLNTLRQEIRESMEAQVSYFLDSLDSELSRIKTLQLDLVNDRDIVKLAAIPESLDLIDTIFSLLRVEKRLQTVKNSSAYIEEVTVMLPSIQRQVTPSSVSELDTELFEQLVMVPLDLDRDILLLDEKILLVTQYPLPFSSNLRRVQFVIFIEIKPERMRNALKALASGDESITALFLSPELVLTSENKLEGFMVKPSNPSTLVLVDGRRYLGVSKESVFLDSVLYKFMPEDVVFRSLRTYHAWFYGTIFMAFIIILIYSANVYSFIHQPLSRLAEAFKHLEKGDFNIHINHTHEDEFRYIYGQFNSMSGNLRNLIDQVYHQKILVQKAQMRQLQSQINPHFLYNAFFMLNTMIRTGDIENLEEITSKLGKYFRFITTNASETIPLEEEVSHARIYADIQALRFQNRVSMIFEPLPDEYRAWKVPRLILQPILENAFEHGLSKDPEGGMLRVDFIPAGEFLDVRIENGGRYLKEGELMAIRTILEKRTRDGETSALANIHERLRMKFGASFGLAVEPGSIGGLRVTVRIGKDV